MRANDARAQPRKINKRRERDTILRAWRHGSTDITVVRAHSTGGAFCDESYNMMLQKRRTATATACYRLRNG